MYCADCGAELPATAKFCLECGQKRETATISVEPVTSSLRPDGQPVDPTRDVWGQSLPRSGQALSDKTQATSKQQGRQVADLASYSARIQQATHPFQARRQAIAPRRQLTAVSETPSSISLTSGYLAIAAAVLVVVGSLGPWAAVTAPFGGSLTVSGMDGDGKITLCLGIATAVLLAFLVTSNRSSAWLGGGAGIALGITAIIGINDWQNVTEAIGTDEEIAMLARVGWGLQVMTIGAIVGAVLALVQAVKATALT